MTEENNFINRLASVFDNQFSVSSYFNFNNPLLSPIKLSQFSILEQKDYQFNFEYSSGGSCKPTREQAFIAGTCEYLERYSLRQPLLASPLRALKDISSTNEFLDLESIRQMQGIHPFQFNIPNCRLEPIDETTAFRWVEATELFSNHQIKVPVEMVRMVRNKYFEVTTSGCSIGSTVQNAIIGGAYELIERHLVMSFWWKKIKPVYFDLESILKTHLPHIHWAFGPWLKNIRLASIPNEFGLNFFMAFFWGENSKRQPAFNMSAACNLDPVKAIERALCELASMINYKIANFESFANETTLKTQNFDLDIITFEAHQNLYNLDFAKEFLFFKDEGPRGSDLSDFVLFKKEDELEILKSKLKSAGFNPYFIDMTPRDIKGLGLHTLRIFDPKAIQINAKHSARRWGQKELFDHNIKTILDLNQFPHPFP